MFWFYWIFWNFAFFRGDYFARCANGRSGERPSLGNLIAQERIPPMKITLFN
jgi:hypothetical protein